MSQTAPEHPLKGVVMSVREEIISALLPDEPNYPVVAQYLGEGAGPVLAELAGGDDVELASRAAALAKHLSSRFARLHPGVGSRPPRPGGAGRGRSIA